ncbi:MAG: hypothetical protein ACFCU5_16390 [Pleurocapsa sp.]
MYQPEGDFDPEKSIENLKKFQSNRDQNSDRNLSVDNIKAHTEQIKRIFFKLIALGLVGGVILSIVTVILLKKFGLTDKPSEIQPKQQQQLPATEINHIYKL